MKKKTVVMYDLPVGESSSERCDDDNNNNNNTQSLSKSRGLRRRDVYYRYVFAFEKHASVWYHSGCGPRTKNQTRSA